MSGLALGALSISQLSTGPGRPDRGTQYLNPRLALSLRRPPHIVSSLATRDKHLLGCTVEDGVERCVVAADEGTLSPATSRRTRRAGAKQGRPRKAKSYKAPDRTYPLISDSKSACR